MCIVNDRVFHTRVNPLFGVLVMNIPKWGTNNDLVERCSQVRTTLPVEPKNWGLWGGFYYA